MPKRSAGMSVPEGAAADLRSSKDHLMFNSRMALVIITLAGLALYAAGGRSVTLYVDDDAPPGGNGATWTTAHDDLQDALAIASTNGAVSEIHVAAGVYTPDRGSGDRTATFQLLNNVTLLGDG